MAYRVLNVERGCHEVLYGFLKVINIESSLCWPFQIVTLLGDSLLILIWGLKLDGACHETIAVTILLFPQKPTWILQPKL